jgi:phenylacetate-CoA ligase
VQKNLLKKIANHIKLLDFYQRAKKFNNLSRKEKDSFINKKIRNLVKCAYFNTSYYRELFKEHRIDYEKIRKKEDLTKIPVTEKISFRNNMSKFYNVEFRNGYEFSTSGSTGIPVKISYDENSLLNYLAITQRQRNITKKFVRTKGKKIFIVLPIPEASSYKFEKYIHEILFVPKFLRKRYQYHDIQLPINDLVNIIKTEKPSIVGSYGSFVSFFARNLRERDLKVSYPDLFVYSSDHCPKSDIEFLLNKGICVLSNYTCAESICIAYQKEPLGNLLIHEDAVYLWNNENNDIILTNIANNGTILLNYNFGDNGNITYDSDIDRFLVENLEGTSNCSLILKDNKIIPYVMIDQFFHLNGLIRFQIIQKNTSYLKINIITKKNFERIKEIIEKRLRALIPYDVEIKIENVTEIEREKSGKFKPIIIEKSSY